MGGALKLIGTIINSSAVIAGASAGLALKGRLPEKVAQTLLQGIGLFTLVIGIQMAITTKNPLVVIFGMVIGGIIGELIDIEAQLERLGKWVESKLSRGEGSEGAFAKGFVATSILFCVGPMAIMGSISDGLKGDSTILVTKSVMDGLASVAFASSLGAGVMASSLSLLIYQGALTLGASAVSGLLTDPIVTEMTAAGGLLIAGIGINILEIRKIRVGNLLPALLAVIVLVPAASWLDGLLK